MPHDQLFKDLLKAFFAEFMVLFFPDVAENLDFSQVTYLDKEIFTDLPQGAQRETDVVAQIYTNSGVPEIVLVHIEVEAQRRKTFPERMFEYYMLLRLRHRLNVFPIVIYLSPGAGGLVAEKHVERMFDRDINVFAYAAVGLPDMNADDYQDVDNSLAPALSALMKTSRMGKVIQKFHSLQAMATSTIDDARRAILANVVETYLVLDSTEQAEFNDLTETAEGEGVKQMISIYEQRGIEQGVLRAKRETVLRLLRRKFGELSGSVEDHVAAQNDAEELDTLAEAVLAANTLDELGLSAR